MENFFARSWRVLALRGACGVLFGALALMWPQLTLLTLVALFAAYALFSGITAIAGAIRHRKQDDDWWVMLLLGIVSTGAGALATAWLIGMYAFVTGALLLVAAFRARAVVTGKQLAHGERRSMMGDRRAAPAR